MEETTEETGADFASPLNMATTTDLQILVAIAVFFFVSSLVHLLNG